MASVRCGPKQMRAAVDAGLGAHRLLVRMCCAYDDPELRLACAEVERFIVAHGTTTQVEVMRLNERNERGYSNDTVPRRRGRRSA